MMWVYQILDIIGTLLETTGIYILVKAYCPNIKNKVASFIPPVVFLQLPISGHGLLKMLPLDCR